VFALTLQSAWDSAAALQSQQDRQRRASQTKPVNPQRPPSAGASAAKSAGSLPAGANGANLAMAQLQVPWGAVLGELESITSKDVALLGLEAQGTARRVRLSAQTKSMGRALQYVAALRELPGVESAELSSHEEKPVAGLAVLHFAVDLQWKATP
jgi:hypothetical protein